MAPSSLSRKGLQRVCNVADIHLHPFSAFSSVGPDGISSRSRTKVEALNETLRISVERGCSEIWLLGDIFHVKGKMPPDEYLEFFGWCQRVLDSKLKLRVVAGNHDYVRDASNRTLLQSIPCSSLVKDKITIERYGTTSVAFVPWRDRANAGSVKADILVGHLDVRGATLNAAGEKDKGGIDASTLGSCEMVLLGHYHLRQKIGENVCYIGSLLPDSFGEANRHGGFGILDIDKKRVVFEDLTGFPRFLTCAVGESGLNGLACKGDYVRVSGVRTMAEEESIHGELKGRGALAVIFERNKNYECESRIPVDKCGSLDEMMTIYVDNVLSSTASLDKKRLMEIGKKLVG